LLESIKKQGLFKTIEQGIFAGIKRPMDGGKGLSGVILKDERYINPFIDLMSYELKKGGC
jgi:beta-lysine 5,6-aminomutase alpha subunit